MAKWIQFKEQVRVGVQNLWPETVAGLSMALATAPIDVKGDTLVVTSANDGRHKRGSRHYQGLAFDIRLRDAHGRVGTIIDEAAITLWCTRLRDALPSWDIIDEGDHLHLEYDPK